MQEVGLAIFAHIALKFTSTHTDLGGRGFDQGVTARMLGRQITAGIGEGPLHHGGPKLALAGRRIEEIFIDQHPGCRTHLEQGTIDKLQLHLRPIGGLDLFPLKNAVPSLEGPTLPPLTAGGSGTGDPFYLANRPTRSCCRSRSRSSRSRRISGCRNRPGYHHTAGLQRQQQRDCLRQQKGPIGCGQNRWLGTTEIVLHQIVLPIGSSDQQMITLPYKLPFQED